MASKTYIPLERLAALFGIEPSGPSWGLFTNAHLFQCIAFVAEQDATHFRDGIDKALEQLTEDPRDSQNGVNVRGLALALNLTGDENEEQVVTALAQVAAKVYRGMDVEKARVQRLALVGLSVCSVTNQSGRELTMRELVMLTADPSGKPVHQLQRDARHAARLDFHASVTTLNAAVAEARKNFGLDHQAAFNLVMLNGGKVVPLNADGVGEVVNLVIGPGRKISDSLC